MYSWLMLPVMVRRMTVSNCLCCFMNLYQKSIISVDFAHCVTVKWMLVVKGKPPLPHASTDKHKSDRRAAGTSSLKLFF